MKLCVFPNDPLIAYYHKGEIKEKYFNPDNIFDEIHVISFINKDIESEKIQKIAGNAKFFIHPVGKITYFNRLFFVKKIQKIISTIKPDIIRSYNPKLEGWMATKCAKKFNIPHFVSIHVQHEGILEHAKKNNLKKFIALKYSQKFIEPFVLKNAEKITIVYKMIEPYIKKMCNQSPEVLYNRVNLLRFHNTKKKIDNDIPVILTVGRLTSQKNPKLIINAIKNLDIKLIMIGDGELFEDLQDLVKRLKISEKVIFKKSVPNHEIQEYYKSSNLFVLAYEPNIEGLPIPVLEAMASGLPIVIPYPLKDYSDGIEDVVEFARLNSQSYEKSIKKIITNKKFSKLLGIKAQEKSLEFDGKKMESREAEIYLELLKNKHE